MCVCVFTVWEFVYVYKWVSIPDLPFLKANNVVDKTWDNTWLLKCRWCIKTRKQECFQCLMGSGHLHLIRLCGFFVFLTSEVSQDGRSSFAAIWGLLSFQKWTISVIIYSVFKLLALEVCVRASGHGWHSRCTCERIKIQDFFYHDKQNPNIGAGSKWHVGSVSNGQINMTTNTEAHVIACKCMEIIVGCSWN